MKHYIGLDISNIETSICIVNESGKIVKYMTANSDPKDIEEKIRGTGLEVTAIGLETGPMSDWFTEKLRKCLHNKSEAGSGFWKVKLLNSFKMGRILEMNVNKHDPNDAFMVAEVTRIECFSGKFNLEVYCKSSESREIRSLIHIRQNNVGRLTSIYNEIRGSLKSFGITLPTATPKAFCGIVRNIIKDLSPIMKMVITASLTIYEAINRELEKLKMAIETMAEKNEDVQRLTKLDGVGSILALYFVATIEDRNRFKNAKNIGAYFGLTPTQYASGETKIMKGISKRGDKTMRSLLFEAATTVLYRAKKKTELKIWGLKLEKKIGSKKARVGIARKLSIIMYQVFSTQKPYIEKAPKPKQTRCTYQFTTQELENLLTESKKNGSISVKNIKQLKPLAVGCTEVVIKK